MQCRAKALFFALVLCAGLSAQEAQEYERVLVRGGGIRTMKPLAQGAEYAVTSMRHHATMAAEHVLRSGGNAFDAAVAGQAVLGVVQPFSNGIGGDATLLVFDAKQKKAWSVNAEGTAPRLATIEWYKQNHGGSFRSTTRC